jgi:flagellar basal body-associated protein FliL
MIKFLLILFIIIFIVARFAGYFFRLMFWLLGKKIEKEVRKQQSYAYASQTPRPEGEIYIKKNPLSSRHNDNEGEFVDFEEVK